MLRLVKSPFGRVLVIIGAVLIGLVTLVVILAVRDARRVARAMDEITARQRPLAEAAFEIEINVFELAAAAMSFRVRRDSADLRLVRLNREELESALAQYSRLSATSADSTDLAIQRQLRDRAHAYVIAADSVVAATERAPPASRSRDERRALTTFYDMQRGLDAVLDSQVQPRAITTLHEAAERARRNSRRTALLIAFIAPLALLLGIFAIQSPIRAYRGMRDAHRKAELASQAKTEFASITAHELRSPLTAILGSLRLMASGRAGLIPETAVPYVEMASRNSVRLLDLINELLDLDRLEAGMLPMKTDPIVSRDLVQLSAEGLSGMAADLGVFIVTDCKTKRSVRGDPARLQQVFVNLISNALKHTPRATTVNVTAEDRNGAVRFSVTDRGPGIAPPDRERIFKRYGQTGSASQHPGTGLGLAIAREIVQRHGGHIGVDSTLGQGATFWFEVPALN